MSNPRTVRQMLPAVGATVSVRFEACAFRCKVIDAKNAWGQVRLLVEPVSGIGQQWVELGRLVESPVRQPGELAVSRV